MTAPDPGWTQANAFNRAQGAPHPPSYPNELLVKLCSSRQYSALTAGLFLGPIDVLEVGCFSGNNLRFFMERGWRVRGAEINTDLIDMGRNNLRRLGLDPPEIRLGNNLQLPWDDESFDLLVSINTLHYSAANEVVSALREFRRTLRSSGVAIIETVGPGHFAFQRATRCEDLEWVWNAGGFRDGQTFGFFDSIHHYSTILSKVFANVEVNVRTEAGPRIQLEFMTAVCSGYA